MKKRTPCVHLRIFPDKDGKVRQRKNQGYHCECPIPDLPVVPASVKVSTSRSYAWSETCAVCPLWEARK